MKKFELPISLNVLANRHISVTTKGVYTIYKLIQHLEDQSFPTLADLKRYLPSEDEKTLIAAIEELRREGVL